ncbi:MAG: polysaccharide biosynthesis/export family protein [Acidobacteriia bacterium]|nr:polysaccharide biosynthesis/export family protein [Terriglobia bacterium]
MREIISRRLCKSLFFLGVLLALPVAVAKQDARKQQVDAAAPANNRPEPLYVIQPNDVLEIFVWKEPELTRKVLVRPDGRISFPLVQDMQAAGISPGELKDKIEGKLKEYLNAPAVTIIVEAIRSYVVYVVGKVQKPGAVVLEKQVTVLQALALAGGFQDFAKDSEITVIRNLGKENVVFEFNYRDVIKGRQPEQNILLRSGDVVVVP